VFISALRLCDFHLKSVHVSWTGALDEVLLFATDDHLRSAHIPSCLHSLAIKSIDTYYLQQTIHRHCATLNTTKKRTLTPKTFSTMLFTLLTSISFVAAVMAEPGLQVPHGHHRTSIFKVDIYTLRIAAPCRIH
jgi:hypothetical protein